MTALIDTVDLEHVLGQVDPNGPNLHGGRILHLDVVDQPSRSGTSVPKRRWRPSH